MLRKIIPAAVWRTDRKEVRLQARTPQVLQEPSKDEIWVAVGWRDRAM